MTLGLSSSVNELGTCFLNIWVKECSVLKKTQHLLVPCLAIVLSHYFCIPRNNLVTSTPSVRFSSVGHVP
jgi:hypothetical protein